MATGEPCGIQHVRARRWLVWTVMLSVCGCGAPSPDAAGPPRNPSVAAASAGATPPPPPAAAPLPVRDDATRRAVALAQRVLAHVRAGKIALARSTFSPAMTEAMSAEQLAALWPALEARFGAFVAQRAVRHQAHGRQRFVWIAHEFANYVVDIRVVLDAEGRVAGLWLDDATLKHRYTPPAYVDTTAFVERPTTVGTGRWILPGTLSVPKGDGPFAAVVLVHGSGPSDRDESLGPNKPFRDLAWGLATTGVAVLRYDKRTLHYRRQLAGPEGQRLTMKEETVDDAVAAVATARAAAEVSAQRVFVLGHSLGGRAIPRIAARQPDARGFIIMAGPTLPTEDILLEQIRYLARLDGKTSPQEWTTLAKLAAKVARVKTLRPDSQITPSELPLGLGVPYWLDLAAHRPTDLFAAERRPVLVLHADRDYQVSLDNLTQWQRALQGNHQASFKRYPDLNHLFMAGAGPSTPTEYDKPGHVAAQVVADIATWIGKQ